MGPDPRFYETLGPVALADLAQAAGAELADPALGARMIEGVAPLGRAGAGAVAFLADRRYLGDLAATKAGACILPAAHADKIAPGCAALLTPEPQIAYARAAARLHRARSHPIGSPAVHPDARIEAGVLLGPGVVIGPGAQIGAGTVIGANAVIGPGVAIGRNGRIGPCAVIGFALIGDRVAILAGAVIGEPGFGVGHGKGGMIDMPQLGRVVLQDGVTIGANACIDRGAFDDTVIGENSKIDNLVQIAHNVRMGRDCVLAALVGISGSTVVGDRVMFGGQAGVADHIVIGDDARIAASAGAMKNVPRGETWGGSPARPLRRFMRETAWLARNAARNGRSGGDKAKEDGE
jgi:UDP-3-O-[3-hydroxymyristoyl] glucosamine N-acyltransferase